MTVQDLRDNLNAVSGDDRLIIQLIYPGDGVWGNPNSLGTPTPRFLGDEEVVVLPVYVGDNEPLAVEHKIVTPDEQIAAQRRRIDSEERQRKIIREINESLKG